ncbi:MAG: hypothetical protein Q7V88_05175 [Actinomycetota bacterium]|nr:hypothetical protein [Actinomycetota bacterium]
MTPVIALGRAGDLHTIGFHMATAGHRLDDVLAWFRRLARRSRRFRRVLRRDGVAHLAAGWADGAMQHQHDPASVAPFEVLRLRLQQQVERTTALGEAPGRHLALVVVEAAGGLGCPERVVRHARDAFHSGETMATTPNGKLLVLVHRDHDVRRRTLRLTDAMRHDQQLLGTPVRVWIEPLAMSAEHVDSHLVGLAS